MAVCQRSGAASQVGACWRAFIMRCHSRPLEEMENSVLSSTSSHSCDTLFITKRRTINSETRIS